MLSLGIEASLAFWMASDSAGLPSGSPPPSLAATVIARASLVKSLPRRASTIAFLCLIPAHLECPAMAEEFTSGHMTDMGAFWDARAREDAAFFVDNELTYGAPDMNAFWARGRQHLEVFLEALGLQVDGGRVLEIGCGLGRLTRVLAERATEVIAVDVSQ